MQLEEQNSQQWHKLISLVKPHSQNSGFIKRKQQLNKLFFNRLLAENCFAFLLQYTGLILAPPSLYPIPLWFASGTAFAFVFIRGYTLLPGLYLGSFVAYYLTKFDPLICIYCATLLTLQPFVLSKLCYRFISPGLIFYHSMKLLQFIFVCFLVTGIVSYLLFLLTFFEFPNPLLWLQWWLADINGILIFSFALVTLDSYFPDFYLLKKINKFHLLFLYGSLLLVTFCLVLCHATLSALVLNILSLTIIIIISTYFSWCGGVAALFLFGLFYGLAANLQAPLFLFNNGILLIELQGLIFIGIIIALLAGMRRIIFCKLTGKMP